MNLNDTYYESATFILPSTLPEDRAGSYRVVVDATENTYRVLKRQPYIRTWPMAAIVIIDEHNTSPVLPDAIPTVILSSSASIIAGPTANEHSPNTQPVTTLRLSPQLSQAEVLPANTVSWTARKSSQHLFAEEMPGAVPTQTAQSSASTDFTNGYYHSPSGVDWAALDEEEEDDHTNSAHTGYYQSPSGENWARIDEEKQEDTAKKQYAGLPITSGHVAVQSGIDSTGDFPSPNLRQYIGPEAEAEIGEELENLPLEIEGLDKVKPEYRHIVRARFARGIVEWGYMCNASRRILASDPSSRRPQLLAADRSMAWLWNLDSTGNITGAEAPALVEERNIPSTNIPGEPEAQRPTELPTHHINFAGRSMTCKSATPPTISLWATFSPYAKDHSFWNGYPLRIHVLASRASLYIDPFAITGLESIPELYGSQLQEFVTGYVEKSYEPYGTWQFEELEPDEDRPRTHEPEAIHVFRGSLPVYNYPVQPYVIDKGNFEGNFTSVNDNGEFQNRLRSHHRNHVGLSSMLSHVDCSPDELTAQLPSLDLEKEQHGIEPDINPFANSNDQVQADQAPADNSITSNEATVTDNPVDDRSSSPDRTISVEEINQRLAEEPVPTVETPNPTSRLNHRSTPSEDEEDSSECTEQSSAGSPEEVKESWSPPSAPPSVADDAAYEDLCRVLQSVDLMTEGVEGDLHDLSSDCSSWDQGDGFKEPETQGEGSLLHQGSSLHEGSLVHECSLVQEGDLLITMFPLVEEEPAPEVVAKDSADVDIPNLSDDVRDECLLSYADNLHTTVFLLVEEGAAPVVESSADAEIADILGDEVMEEDTEAVEVSEETIPEEAIPEEVGTVEVAEETAAVTPSLIEDVEQENEDTGELHVSENGVLPEEVVQADAPEEKLIEKVSLESTVKSQVVEETAAEACALVEDIEQKDGSGKGALNKEGLSGAFSLPQFSDCLLYGSIAVYVGYMVYRAIRR